MHSIGCNHWEGTIVQSRSTQDNCNMQCSIKQKNVRHTSSEQTICYGCARRTPQQPWYNKPPPPLRKKSKENQLSITAHLNHKTKAAQQSTNKCTTLSRGHTFPSKDKSFCSKLEDSTFYWHFTSQATNKNRGTYTVKNVTTIVWAAWIPCMCMHLAHPSDRSTI